MYFTKNLLENWILGGNLVVDKTLSKLCKATTSRDNDICYHCHQLLVEQGKGCTIQSLSADQRGQRQSKNPYNKERGKRVGKRVAYHLVLCHCLDYRIYCTTNAIIENYTTKLFVVFTRRKTSTDIEKEKLVRTAFTQICFYPLSNHIASQPAT